MQCRLRDLTYSAPITVDIEYTRGNQVNIIVLSSLLSSFLSSFSALLGLGIMRISTYGIHSMTGTMREGVLLEKTSLKLFRNEATHFVCTNKSHLDCFAGSSEYKFKAVNCWSCILDSLLKYVTFPLTENFI